MRRNLLVTSLGLGVTLVVILLLVVIGGLPTVPSRRQNCAVSSVSSCSILFNLKKGEQVVGSITTQQSSVGDISFWVTDPTGIVIHSTGKISGITSLIFSAGATGTYLVHLNSILSSPNTVVLNYNILRGSEC